MKPLPSPDDPENIGRDMAKKTWLSGDAGSWFKQQSVLREPIIAWLNTTRVLQAQPRSTDDPVFVVRVDPWAPR